VPLSVYLCAASTVSFGTGMAVPALGSAAWLVVRRHGTIEHALEHRDLEKVVRHTRAGQVQTPKGRHCRSAGAPSGAPPWQAKTCTRRVAKKSVRSVASSSHTTVSSATVVNIDALMPLTTMSPCSVRGLWVSVTGSMAAGDDLSLSRVNHLQLVTEPGPTAALLVPWHTVRNVSWWPDFTIRDEAEAVQ